MRSRNASYVSPRSKSCSRGKFRQRLSHHPHLFGSRAAISSPAPIPINKDAMNANTDVAIKKKPTPNPTSVPPPTAHAPRSKFFPVVVNEFSSYSIFSVRGVRQCLRTSPLIPGHMPMSRAPSASDSQQTPGHIRGLQHSACPCSSPRSTSGMSWC